MPSDPIVSIEPSKTSFKRVKNFVGIFRDQVEDMLEPMLEEASEDFAEMVRTIIVRQKYKWKPLSKRWLKTKEKRGLDLRTHIATGEYLRSIRAIPRKRKGKIVSWGVSPGHHNLIHKSSGMRMHRLARLLEFGSKDKRMPARPHWRPAWSVFVRRRKKLLARKFGTQAVKNARENA